MALRERQPLSKDGEPTGQADDAPAGQGKPGSGSKKRSYLWQNFEFDL